METRKREDPYAPPGSPTADLASRPTATPSPDSFLRRATTAILASWVALVFFSVSMRPKMWTDFEWITTVLVVALAASVGPGLLSAALLKRRPVLMVVSAQLGTAMLLGMISGL